MADSGRKTGSESDLEADALISELRRMYDGVINEPLPDELMELLRKLDEIERKR